MVDSATKWCDHELALRAETSHRGKTVGAKALSAFMEAALDCVIIADATGCVVEFNPAAERTFGYTREEALGRTLAELIVPPSLREAHTRAFARFVETREQRLFGQRLELTGMRADGREFPVELALGQLEGEPLLICGALRDLTDAKRGEEDLRKLANEQRALRRVATLVAQGSGPAEVFASVAEAVAQILGVPAISMIRFDADGSATKIAGWGESPFPVGQRWSLEEPSVMASVKQTGRPARVEDYASVAGGHARRVREAGIRSGVGAPIVVDGKSWGVVVAFATEPEALSADAEGRLTRFTELVATAISNTEARDDLRKLAYEQAALRRVATLIARQARPAEVFAAVAEEAARTLEVALTAVVRYEFDGTATQVGAYGAENPFPVGTAWRLDEHSVSGMVARTGRAARVDDYAEVSGEIAAKLAREAGIRAAVGAPILVDGKPWGVMMALSTEQQELPDSTEARLAAFTELIATAISNIQARDDLRDLAHEQAALRRVATLVAKGTDAAAVFNAVCAETGELMGATSVNLARFTPDGFNLTMAGWSLRDTHVPTGTRLPLSGDTINGLIQRTGAPARFDSYEDSSSQLAAVIRQRGIRSEIGAPVVVEGELWGALIAGTDRDEVLPPGAELRVARFAELVATAVSNATTRSELIASRARIVAAADEARRRLERDLHDGTQQRLVTLALDLQAARARIPADQQEIRSNLERIENETDTILDELRELSRGLHPALLSLETAVYYVISEALTNAAKYSQASVINVTLTTVSDVLRATIEDDGIGGAEASAGSGLIGLIDRIEALGGRFALDSPPGRGTKIGIELPLVPPPSGDVAETVRSAPRSGDDRLLQTNLLGLTDATLLAAITAVADALYIVDAQGRIRFLNPAALRILGYEDELQLLGRPSHDTIHYLRGDGTPFPAEECPLLRPRVTGEAIRVDEDWFVRQDGSLIPVAYTSAPVPLPDGRGAVVSFRDRSDVDAEEPVA